MIRRARFFPRCEALVATLIVLLSGNFRIDSAWGQNIVDALSEFSPANPAKLTDTDVSEFISRAPLLGKTVESSEARRIAAKLDQHVTQFLAGFPWRPFQHTLGISGYEVYFAHPDEMFYALAISLPYLSPPTQAKAKALLAEQLKQSPPYAVEGFDRRAGQPRESYDVPAALRIAGRSQAGNAFGVYAFWAWCHYAQDSASVGTQWDSVKSRLQPLLIAPDTFDVLRQDSGKGESELLNGNLAGLLALVRLARLNNDAATEAQARKRTAEWLERRVNLDRLNPRILERSNAATKGLHNFKLARYCALAPEVGEAVRAGSDGRAAAYLKAFREERNGWFLAFGDRLVGGENYTNPLHFPRSLFSGAALIERLPSEQLMALVDVPWCPGDFYFMEKCVFSLWAASGWPWEKLP